MNTFNLVREVTGDQGCFGVLTVGPRSFQTGELPWRNNEADLSHIPIGTYQCDWLLSPHFNRNLYHIQNVPQRQDCLIHMGNWCGDTKKGFKSDVEGCVILGLEQGLMDGQEAVLQSVRALAQVESILNGESFLLNITEQYS